MQDVRKGIQLTLLVLTIWKPPWRMTLEHKALRAHNKGINAPLGSPFPMGVLDELLSAYKVV